MNRTSPRHTLLICRLWADPPTLNSPRKLPSENLLTAAIPNVSLASPSSGWEDEDKQLMESISQSLSPMPETSKVRRDSDLTAQTGTSPRKIIGNKYTPSDDFAHYNDSYSNDSIITNIEDDTVRDSWHDERFRWNCQW
jgi:hypothetical protein